MVYVLYERNSNEKPSIRNHSNVRIWFVCKRVVNVTEKCGRRVQCVCDGSWCLVSRLVSAVFTPWIHCKCKLVGRYVSICTSRASVVNWLVFARLIEFNRWKLCSWYMYTVYVLVPLCLLKWPAESPSP